MRRLGIAVALVAVVVVALATVAVNSRPAEAAGSILVYTGNDAFNPGIGFTEFGNATGKPVVTSTTLPADLSPFDCVVLPLNETAFDTGQKTMLSGYINAGGRIVAQADNDTVFLVAIATMNDLAAALGSGLSLVPASIDSGFNTTTNIDASSFTAGVSSIVYGATSEVAVSGTGESLVRTIGGTTFIGADPIGSGIFFLLGDLNVLSDQSGTGYTSEDNGVLAANMCGGAGVPPAPTITLDPPTDTNTVGEDHTVTAMVEEEGSPLDADVEFEVTAGPNAGDSGTDDTAGNGEATFTYTGDGGAGTDTIEACVVDFPELCAEATKTWEEPTPTPTPSPTPTPTPSPTPTPTVAAAVQLPTTGGTPSDGGSSALPWLAAIAGAIALIGSGSTWFAYQRRRVR